MEKRLTLLLGAICAILVSNESALAQSVVKQQAKLPRPHLQKSVFLPGCPDPDPSQPAELNNLIDICKKRPLGIKMNCGGCEVENVGNGAGGLKAVFNELADTIADSLNTAPLFPSASPNNRGLTLQVFFRQPRAGIAMDLKHGKHPLFDGPVIFGAARDTSATALAPLFDKAGLSYAVADANIMNGGLSIEDSFNNVSKSVLKPLSWLHGGLTCKNSFDQPVLSQLPFDRGFGFAQRFNISRNESSSRPVIFELMTGGCSVKHSFNNSAGLSDLVAEFMARLTSKVPASKLAAIGSIQVGTGGLTLKDIFNN